MKGETDKDGALRGAGVCADRPAQPSSDHTIVTVRVLVRARVREKKPKNWCEV